MNKKHIPLYLIVCLTMALKAFAGMDPVGWSLNPSSGFPAQTTVGNSYSVVYTFTNHLPQPVPLTVTATYTGGQFSIHNECIASSPLAAKGQPNSSCIVAIQYLPNKPGSASVHLVMNYHNNVVPLPILSTITTGASTTTPIQGYVSQALPAITYTGNTYPVSFTYVNNGTTPITATAVTVSGFSPTSNTCSSPLAIPGSGGQCTVIGSFSPVTVGGPITFSVTYTYPNGSTSVSVPLSTTTIVHNGTNCHHIHGTAELPLPSQTYIYSDNVVKYTFTNYCAQETLSGVILSQSGGTATLTPGTNTCTGTLPQGNSCSYYVSVIPTTTATDLQIAATLTYAGRTATVTTSEKVLAIPNQSTTHTLTFVNQCKFPVWYEFDNGGGQTSLDPTPAGGSYQLNGQIPGHIPATIDLSVNEYINGAIYARTGCDTTTGVCATGSCTPSSASDPMRCAVGQQSSNFPPLTKFELTMNATPGIDGVYDVSMVNGFNVPGQVRSRAPVVTGPPPAHNAPYPFNCGQSGGALIQPLSTGLGACPWTFSPPNTGGIDIPPNYTAVVGDAADGCISTGSCTGTDSCGMGFDGAQFQRRCASFLGFTNILTYTGYSAPGQWGVINLYNDFDLGDPIVTAAPPPGYGTVSGSPATYTAMWGCIPTSTGALKSGYAKTYLVCGCYDWNQTGSLASTAQVSQCLTPPGQNPDWIATVFPRILWFKQACPTAYSYNHDDASASFTCNQASKKTSYQITFCPGGVTGQPS